MAATLADAEAENNNRFAVFGLDVVKVVFPLVNADKTEEVFKRFHVVTVQWCKSEMRGL